MQPLGVDAALGGEVALGGLGVAHLERGEQDALAFGERDVAGDLEAQQALAHRRAGGDDVQPSVLEPAEQPVEIADAGREPGDPALVVGGLLEPVELLGDRVLEQPLLGGSSRAAQREDQPLGLLDQLLAAVAALGDLGLDLVGRAQQRAQLRVLAHDPAVFAGVAGGRYPAGELVDRCRPADRSSRPRSRRTSATVRWSILRAASWSCSIAANTLPCCSR